MNVNNEDRLLLENVTWVGLRENTAIAREIAYTTAFAGGQNFSRIRPIFVQVEGRSPSTRHCIEREAARHGYELSSELGHDNNTLMTRSNFPADYSAADARRQRDSQNSWKLCGPVQMEAHVPVVMIRMHVRIVGRHLR